MANSQGRLVGWKSIAAYFGRDRKTVARWARERKLPVHQIPGGKQSSVFAFEHELAAWTRQHLPASDESQDESAEKATRSRHPALTRVLGALVVVLAAALLLSLLMRGGAPRAVDKAQALPRDPAVAADYVTARDAWGRRTGRDIETAIRLYNSVVDRDPNFAQARAGLAEAWLLYREYGGIGDARAYGAARIAAQKALSLDPELASGHRALGFIQYWWENDPTSAIASFKRAIALDGKDHQTLFWFANVLADVGEYDAAERYYRRAILLSPGSRPIEVERACAQWQAGRDQLALKMMTELAARYPDDATIPNCLAWVHIGLGDIRGYARELGRSARLRDEPALLRLAAALDKAVATDPATAHRVLIAETRREIASGTRRIREVPAFYASAMGDRAELVALMREAAQLGERWHSPSVTRRIADRWRSDREVSALLARLQVIRPHEKDL